MMMSQNFNVLILSGEFSRENIERLIWERDEIQLELNDLQLFTQLENDLNNASILEKQQHVSWIVCVCCFFDSKQHIND